MAELNAPWTLAETHQQYHAVLRLRWQMLRNTFRRKGGKGELIALIVLLPLLGIVALSIAGAAGGVAWYAVQRGHYDWLAIVLWGIFAITLLTNIQLGQPGTTFDPTQLIRFPLRPWNYAFIRLFFGVLSPANVVLFTSSLAVVIGVSVANAHLWGYATLAMAIFVAVNALFTRMLFSWVDRWLSTRRAREVFTAIIFAGSLGINYLNINYNPTYRHHGHVDPKHAMRMVGYFQHAIAYLNLLPPGLTSKSIAAGVHHAPLLSLGWMAACTAFGAVFFAVFALRMRAEFRGEVLSDNPGGSRRVTTAAAVQPTLSPESAARVPAVTDAPPAPGLSTVVPAVLVKEWVYLRRNLGLMYGLIGPLFFVFLFAGKMMAHTNGPWVFQVALAYGLLGVVPVSYNSLGLDGTGAQIFFITPVRLRDVLLGKNLFNVALAFLEVAAVWAVLAYNGHTPNVLTATVSLLWVAMTLLLELTVGNYRSITAPKKIDITKVANKQASPLSALLAMGILLASGGTIYLLEMLVGYLGVTWVMLPVLVLLTAVAAWVYWTNLEKLDLYAFSRREQLFEELGKKA